MRFRGLLPGCARRGAYLCGQRVGMDHGSSWLGNRSGCGFGCVFGCQCRFAMLGGMRRDRCGKEENQGNYCCKIERDARCHDPQLHSDGTNPAGLVRFTCSVVTSTSVPEVTVHTTSAGCTTTKVQVANPALLLGDRARGRSDVRRLCCNQRDCEQDDGNNVENNPRLQCLPPQRNAGAQIHWLQLAPREEES